jgi:hypothetical protein
MKHILKQGVALVLLLLFVVLFAPNTIFASKYGECGYGEGKYSDGCQSPTPSTTTSTTSDSTANGSSSPSVPMCTDQTPGSKAPWLYAAIPQSGTSVLLYFAEADGPLDSYALQFGTQSGDYPYGSTNIGGKDTRTYLVQSLSPNTTYYFRVRAGNGCATGPWSNEISVKTKALVSFNQVVVTDSSLETMPEVPADKVEPVDSCETYTVKRGDTLWSIANSQLDDGNKYKDIIEQNKETYPSLENSNNLKVGWNLKLNCSTLQEGEKTTDPGESEEGYRVNVKVVDQKNTPVKGAKITIHSKVQEATTDENGLVHFNNVEQGQHQVLIAYNGYQGEQSVNLTGDTKEFNLSFTIQMKPVLLSPQVLTIVGMMGLVIVSLSFLLIRARSRKI